MSEIVPHKHDSGTQKSTCKKCISNREITWLRDWPELKNRKRLMLAMMSHHSMARKLRKAVFTNARCFAEIACIPDDQLWQRIHFNYRDLAWSEICRLSARLESSGDREEMLTANELKGFYVNLERNMRGMPARNEKNDIVLNRRGSGYTWDQTEKKE